MKTSLYYATFSTSSTFLSEPIKGSNKKEMVSTIKNILKGNTPMGNKGYCKVWHYQYGQPVLDYFGRIYNGRVYEDKEYELNAR